MPPKEQFAEFDDYVVSIMQGLQNMQKYAKNKSELLPELKRLDEEIWELVPDNPETGRNV